MAVLLAQVGDVGASGFEDPQAQQPISPRLDPCKDAIDAMLRTDLDAPREQRHTATRILPGHGH